MDDLYTSEDVEGHLNQAVDPRPAWSGDHS